MSNLFKKVGIPTQPKSFFSKGGFRRKKLLSKGSLDLQEALYNSYQPQNVQEQYGKKEGYEYDKGLSNDNQQIYYNKDNGHLMMSITGTHNLQDVGTDAYLMSGKLKDTNRYKQADMTFKKAVQKYNPKHTTAIGNSLGGSIASKINADHVITHNRGYEPGGRTRNNETAIRTSGDVISIFGSGAKNMHTYHKKGYSLDDYTTWLRAHKTDSIKGSGYKIPDSK